MTTYYRIEAWRAWFYIGIISWVATVIALLEAQAQNPGLAQALLIIAAVLFLIYGVRALERGWSIELPQDHYVGVN